MRPDLVVVDPVRLDLLPRVVEADEPVFVQALVPELPVEALDVRVLDRLPRPDEVESDAALERPAVHDAARELGAVVDADDLGPAGPLDELLQQAPDARPRERVVDLDEQALGVKASTTFSVLNLRPVESESSVKSIVHCWRGRVGGGRTTRSAEAIRFRFFRLTASPSAR